jgi:hypothetical protein
MNDTPHDEEQAPKMNIPLLEELERTIPQHALQFIMGDWFEYNPDLYGNCGTAACIAGWAVTLALTLSKRPRDGQDLGGEASAIAMRELGLTSEQARRLFYKQGWPDPFWSDYKTENQENAEHNAKVAARRIRHFIDTEGRE